MSTGKTHAKASLILASALSITALITLNANLVECAIGSVVGVLVSPDADVDKGNISNKFIKNKTGWFGERAWRFFWSGYSSSFKHGQFASHFPVFGTFVRVAYVYFWIVFLPHVIFYVLVKPPWELAYVLTWYAKLFLSDYFVGLACADIIHFTLDKLTKNAD